MRFVVELVYASSPVLLTSRLSSRIVV